MTIDMDRERWLNLTGPHSNMLAITDATAIIRDLHGIAPDRITLVLEVRLTRNPQMPSYLQALDVSDDMADQLIAVLSQLRGYNTESTSEAPEA